MNSSTNDIVFQFGPYFRKYKDGRVERFFGTDKVHASVNSSNGVSSKDVLIVSDTGVAARIFVPSTVCSGQKLPLLVYFHGGGFIVGSLFCAIYHNYVSSLVATANVVAVSIDYRLAPECPVPIPYEDSWATLKWVASHKTDHGLDPWLTNHADFNRVFLAGDSAGANIVHHMAAQVGVEKLHGLNLLGICLIHPYFGSKDCGIDESYWSFVSPTTSGSSTDFRINPAVDSRLGSLGCTRVLICLAEKDHLRERGLFYYETLRNSGWKGDLEIMETEGEEHVFHLFNPNCENAVALLLKLASFINKN